MARVSSLAVIENAGPNSLRAALCASLRGGESVDLAVAYIKAGGLEAINPSLLAAASRGKVRILTTLQFGITEPKALWKLLRQMNSTDGQFEARLSEERHFHAKGYFITKVGVLTAFIGSSNLTRDGLESEGELNLRLAVPAASSLASQLRHPFEQQWENRSVLLSTEVIKEYERRWRTAQSAQRRAMISLDGILRLTSKRSDTPSVDQRERNFWRDWVNSTLGEAAGLIVDRATNWEKRGWTYSMLGKNQYRVGDRVLLFDVRKKTVEAVEVKAKTEIATSEGRYFVAHRRLSGTKLRGLIKKRWAKLKELGIVSKQADLARRVVLSKAKWLDVQAAMK